MKALAAIAVLILAGCDQAHVFATQPPKAYQGQAMVLTLYADDPPAECAKLGNRPEIGTDGRYATGCYQGLDMPQTIALLQQHGIAGLIVVPNPCPWPNDSDLRQLGCHEKGHALGGHHDEAGRWTQPTE